MILDTDIYETEPTVESILEELVSYAYYQGSDSNVASMTIEERRTFAEQLLPIRQKKRQDQVKCQENVRRS